MTRRHHDKLVRDRIPELIARSGATFETQILDEVRFRAALLEKLVEEAKEAATAPDTHALVTELADVWELLDAVVANFGIDRASVDAVRAERRVQRGGFEQRIRLLWTETE